MNNYIITANTVDIRNTGGGSEGLMSTASTVKAVAQRISGISELLTSACSSEGVKTLMSNMMDMQRNVHTEANRLESVGSAMVQMADNIETTEARITEMMRSRDVNTLSGIQGCSVENKGNASISVHLNSTGSYTGVVTRYTGQHSTDVFRKVFVKPTRVDNK